MNKLYQKVNQIYLQIATYFFHKAFYNAGNYGETWKNTWWLGTRLYKQPFDLWVYQEIIFENKPDIVIETGTAYGGSALYFAHIMDLINHGEVITIDINPQSTPPHKRVSYLKGSSTSISILERVIEKTQNKKVMVVLDSNHSLNHVLNELNIYANMVSIGQYLIVEDTNLNNNPVSKFFGPGPYEAIQLFMTRNKNFRIDRSREKYYFSFNKYGFLIKTA